MNEDWTSREEELKRVNDEIDLKLLQVKRDAEIDIDGIISINDYIQRPTARQSPSADSPSLNVKLDSIFLDDKETNGNPPKTKIRIQEAEIKSLAKQLENAQRIIQELKDRQVESFQNDKKLLMERKLIQAKSASGGRNQKITTELENFRAENQSLKKEVSGLQSRVKNAETASQSREVRLKRALDSVEQLKQTLLQRKMEKTESTANSRKDHTELEEKIKELERQRSDLLLGFKKQMQLIDVLKRQKIHVEASRMLDFREEEFKSVLDWGCES